MKIKDYLYKNTPLLCSGVNCGLCSPLRTTQVNSVSPVICPCILVSGLRFLRGIQPRLINMISLQSKEFNENLIKFYFLFKMLPFCCPILSIIGAALVIISSY